MAHPDLGEGTRVAASTGPWIVFEDEAGATLRPPKARAWAGLGRTPQVAVSGRGGRVLMAALVCYRPGHRSRLVYRILVHRRRTGERSSFSEVPSAPVGERRSGLKWCARSPVDVVVAWSLRPF